MDYVIGVAFAAILAALAAAGIFMLREGRDGKPRSEKMLYALALRVGLSILLFGFILLAWQLGWIQPSGIPAGR
jgi:hypothetical protein